MWKGCAFAHAARNGVFAALLAREGMTGPAPCSRATWASASRSPGPFDLPKLGGPSADDWMLPKTSIKFVPAEYHSQSAIAAAFELRAQDRRPAADPLDRDRHVPHGGRDHRPGPREVASPKTRETADHSLPYCTAVALVDGEVSAAPVHPRAARRSGPARPGLADDRRRGPRPDGRAIPPGIPNRVRVTLDDGTSTLESEVAFPPGHDKNPLTDAQLATKFHGLADPALGAPQASAIWERLARLEADPAPHESILLLVPR